MNSILAAALGGAIGGALGGALGMLLARFFPEKWRQTVRTICSVALVVIGWQVAVAVLAPRLTSEGPATIEATLLEDSELGPLAQAWRSADPASYSRYAEEMAEGARRGLSNEQLVNNARATMLAAAVPRILYLEDDQINESGRLSIDHLENLRRNQPRICRPFFMGEPFGDMTPYVSENSVRRERALLEAAFRVDMSAPKRITQGAEFEATLARVLADTRTSVGDDVLMLTGAADATGRDEQFCVAASAFYNAILDLPPAESAAFLRALRAPA